MTDRPRAPSAIAVDLRGLGLALGDLVMVHASMRAIGPIDRGADGIIDAIRSAIGDAGTMMMVLGARNEHAWVNERPEAERVDLLRDADPFDARRTPADPDVGILAEVFRRRPKTCVSDHPEGRFAAAGPAADRLLSDVPWNDYFSPGSPLDRLVADGGKVLRLGANPDTVTALHHAEYLSSASPKRRVRRHRLVATSCGPEVRVVECLDDVKGIVDYDEGDYFADILRAYLAAGRARVGTVGRAQSELIDAAEIVAFAVRWMDEHLHRSPVTTSIVVLQSRLTTDLIVAQRQGSAPEVAAIRSLKTALGNAEAVPRQERPHASVEAGAEVCRRELDADDIAAVITAEIEERQRAIDEYRHIGADSGGLELELMTLERYRGPV